MIMTCPQCGTRNRVDERARQLQPVCGKCGAALSLESEGNDSRPIEVTDATFMQDVLGASKPVLVDCWASWCRPCQMIAPIIDQLAGESQGRYLVAKLNTDDNPRTAMKFQIDSIPTLLIFKDGQLLDRVVGLQPKQALQARLAAVA